jgi:glycosyltransferase involved in cell wall biosynthesis
MIILIPAYEPDQQLPALIRSIRDAEPWATVVVVDDGSGPAYKDVFDGVKALGCHVIGYSRNRGKGFALKTGFGFIADHLPGRDVVCADSDGQHTIVDILRVASAVQPGSPALVLGTRNFTGNVPARSKFGNNATRLLFTLATGERISDTQTGLRGYPASMLPWLRSVRGERYEYEFLASSFTAFLVDTVVFLLLTLVTDSLLLAVVGARAVSSAVNFLVNRRVVFEYGRDRPAAAAGVRYFGLVLVLLAANYGLISALDALSVAALPAKILAEIALLSVSYVVQQRFLFSRRTARSAAREAENHALDPSRGHHPGTLRG